MSTKVQLDAFWRWRRVRQRWAEQHGWTTEQGEQHNPEEPK
jgi:hypothetical protein